MAQAKAKQQQLSDGAPKQLKEYGTVNDDSAKGRRWQMLFFVVIPLICVCIAVWFGFGGGSQAAVDASKPVGASTIAPANLDSIVQGSQFAFASPPAQKVAQAVTPDSRIRCYAIRDTVSISNVIIYKEGLFLADRWSRVNGGLLGSKTAGWFPATDFGCQGDLTSLEVEYMMPVPSPTATKRVVVIVPTKIPTSFPTATLSPTLANGILRLDASGCDVSWLVWNAQAVWIEYAGKREGVAGDSAGKPIFRSMCPYTGTVKLDAWMKDGTRQNRSVSLGGQ
ncbi:MAG: hypothetical protein HZC40_12070 [Chloroflexi bacterium]|nr:hypothetical protein [Chloroflexota bacterium]